MFCLCNEWASSTSLIGTNTLQLYYAEYAWSSKSPSLNHIPKIFPAFDSWVEYGSKLAETPEVPLDSLLTVLYSLDYVISSARVVVVAWENPNGSWNGNHFPTAFRFGKYSIGKLLALFTYPRGNYITYPLPGITRTLLKMTFLFHRGYVSSRAGRS